MVWKDGGRVVLIPHGDVIAEEGQDVRLGIALEAGRGLIRGAPGPEAEI